MRAYFEKFTQGESMSNINFYTAYEAFAHMGFHIIDFDSPSKIPTDDMESVVIGSINFMHRTLKHLGKTYPMDLDYPACLQKYLGRKIWTSNLVEMDGDATKWNVFIKPKGISKKFTGRVIKGVADFIAAGDQSNNTPIWVSEMVDFVREWRVFVRYGKILDIKPYRGDWRVNYDVSIIENAVKDFVNAPNGYAMDFGVTKDGRTLLVEINDGYSLGAYGLFFTDYAKLLSARWAELTGQKDLCDFDMI